MKKIFFISVFLLISTLFAFSQRIEAPRLATVGILPFEAVGPGVSAADAANATNLVIAEMSGWGTMIIQTGDQAENAEYLVRGQISRVNNQIVLSATTTLTRTGRVLNNSREAAATLAAISMETFCTQIAQYIPFPNFLLGRWQSTIQMSYGPVTAILEFRSDRTVRVERFDTWQQDGTTTLKYQAIGGGTYTHIGYLRRTVWLGGRQFQADATLGLNLNLEDALPAFRNINVSGLRVLFDENRDNFELVNAGIPFGNNLFYTRFTRIATPPFVPIISPGPAAGIDGLQVSAIPLWEHDLEDLVAGPPFLQTESAVLATAGGSVKSFFRNGRFLWYFDPDAGITPHISRSMEGAAYVSDATGYFRAVNRVGRELWRTNLGGPVSFAPVVGWDGRVFIPVGSMLSCRTAAGHPLWSIDLGSPMAIAPILDRAGSLVTVLQNRDFVRVNQFSTLDRIRLDEQPLFIVPLRDGDAISYILLFPNGQAERITFNESAARGTRLSRSRIPSLPGIPVSAASAALEANRGDQFAVTLRDGRIILMNSQGQVLWTRHTHESTEERGRGNVEPARSAMLFDERGIYSISTRGVTGFAADGRRRFILRMDEASAVPGFSDEGILFVGGRDRILRGYVLDTKPRTIARSRFYGPNPEGSYGMANPPPSPWSTDRRRFNADEQDIMIARIEAAINSGQIGEREPIYKAYLIEMIGFFLNDPHFSRVRPAVDPIRHVEFLRLIGRIGSRETVPFLFKIFDRYHEPSVRSAAAEAIGSIGVDPYGNTFMSFNFLLAANNPNRDPQLLMSATSSIAALSRFSGPPLAAGGIMILRRFTNLTWAPNALRVHIRQVVDDLYREGITTSVN